MSENGENANVEGNYAVDNSVEDNYKIIFRSSFTESDWFSVGEEGESPPPQFSEFQAGREGPDDKALLDLGKELAQLEEAVSLKDREIAQEREEIGHIKESYEDKLSLLSEREFELNKMEEELTRRKEELEKTKTDTTEQDPRLQIDHILEKGKAMAAVNQNLQAYFFFRLAIYLHPQNATALNNLAISMYKLGFKEKARTCLGKALELDPENEAARINLERMSKAQDA